MDHLSNIMTSFISYWYTNRRSVVAKFPMMLHFPALCLRIGIKHSGKCKKTKITLEISRPETYDLSDRNHWSLSIKYCFVGTSSVFFFCLQFYLSMSGCAGLAVASVTVRPPTYLPDLFPVLVSVYSCAHFLAFLLFFHYMQFAWNEPCDKPLEKEAISTAHSRPLYKPFSHSKHSNKKKL